MQNFTTTSLPAVFNEAHGLGTIHVSESNLTPHVIVEYVSKTHPDFNIKFYTRETYNGGVLINATQVIDREDNLECTLDNGRGEVIAYDNINIHTIRKAVTSIVREAFDTCEMIESKDAKMVEAIQDMRDADFELIRDVLVAYTDNAVETERALAN